MKNVIVVMLDSLQFNYLGCYGNKWIKTPNLDRLAAEGVLFENNYIEGVPTVPCRRSMLTGRYPVHSKGWSEGGSRGIHSGWRGAVDLYAGQCGAGARARPVVR